MQCIFNIHEYVEFYDILQWNGQEFVANITYVLLLLTANVSIVCLQESIK